MVDRGDRLRRGDAAAGAAQRRQPARQLAWTIAAVGAGYLVFWWVLFVLPDISLNVAFLATLGVGRCGGSVDELRQPYRDEYTAS